MKIFETSKFKKLRKKIKKDSEKEALKKAIKIIIRNPTIGKKLKGEFKKLQSYKYSIEGQSKRVIYQIDNKIIIFYSFGPREGIYK